MKATLRRIGTWILMHPRLVSAVAFVALAVVTFLVTSDASEAARRRKP